MMELVFRLTVFLLTMVFKMMAGILYLPHLLLKWIFGKIFSIESISNILYIAVGSIILIMAGVIAFCISPVALVVYLIGVALYFWYNFKTDKSTSNTPYIVSFTGTTGEEYEHYVAERLKHMGFQKVQVTQLSGDFGADVLAYDPDGNKTCIQCKMYSGTVGIAAVQEIYAAKAYYKCDKAMVITTSSFTKAARQLALETDVKLVGNFK